MYLGVRTCAMRLHPGVLCARLRVVVCHDRCLSDAREAYARALELHVRVRVV